jgi:FMN reductase [NAD(P)H]
MLQNHEPKVRAGEPMNDTVRLIQAHRSERSYKSDPIPNEILDSIIESAHLAPTSKNSQQVSIVVVKDATHRKRIAEIAGGQPWIAEAPVFLAIIADLYKTRIGLEKVGETQQTQHSLEAIVSATTDVGIALATIMIAARSYGLGIVPIGGIRRNPDQMVELLGLPEYTFPIVGVSIGYVNEPATQKPRLPIESYRHEERYHAGNLRPAIDAYDASLPDYWKSISRPDGLPWSENTALTYKTVYYPKVKPVAAAQGLTCED